MNDPQNPYDAPRAQVRAERIAQLVVASRAQRLVNLLIDQLACYALVLGALTVYAAFDPAALQVLQAPPDAPWNPKLSALLMIAQFVYYIPMEGMFGITLGKLLTSTRVVDEDGRPPSWWQVLGRTVARQIPFEPFTIFLSGNDRVTAWHDRLPKTLVVRSR